MTKIRDVTSGDAHLVPATTPVLSSFNYPVSADRDSIELPPDAGEGLIIADEEAGSVVYVLSDDEGETGGRLWWASEVLEHGADEAEGERR